MKPKQGNLYIHLSGMIVMATGPCTEATFSGIVVKPSDNTSYHEFPRGLYSATWYIDVFTTLPPETTVTLQNLPERNHIV